MEYKINLPEYVSIFDTTLRDGEQTPGISFSDKAKMKIARQLDKLGVDVIEAGFPSSTEGERSTVKKISSLNLDSDICGLARVVREDMDACIASNVDMVHVFVSTSDVQIKSTIKKGKDEILDLSYDSVKYVKDHGIKCLFSAMDATRTDEGYLFDIYKAVNDAGVDIINVPDTVGVSSPFKMHELILKISKRVNVPIDVHCHNDFGLAVANTLAAVESGAREVQVTMNGIGERSGNASLSEVVMALHSIYGVKTNIKTEYLFETSRLVESYSGFKLPPNFPIVGENAFSHESGIHAHGVIQDSRSFEPGIMTPEMVGHRRRLVLGKHTGRHTIKNMLAEYGISVREEDLREITERVKRLGDKGKKITDTEFYAMAEAVIKDIPKREQYITLNELSVMAGNKITPTAVLKATVDGEEKIGADVGVGPVDAALKTIQDILGSNIRLKDFGINAISGGSDALAEVTINVEDEMGDTVSAMSAREDIIMASVEAYISAVNNLMIKKSRRTPSRSEGEGRDREIGLHT
jgi:isopropylmalate/citramalate/homocitrate synthases